MTEDDAPPPLRPFGASASQSKYIQTLLRRLDDLAKASDPDGGAATERGKDLAAFKAIGLASELTQALAGWAINHQIGLAMRDLSFLPLGPVQLRETPAFKLAREEVDRHDHERNGANATELPPPAQRKALLNIIHAEQRLRSIVREPAVHALEALERGDQRPIFEPQTGSGKGLGAKRSFRARQLILQAVGFMTYRAELSGKKGAAEIDVVEAYGYIGDKTFDGWMRQLRASFDPLEIERTIGVAKNAASHVKEHRRRVRLGDAGDVEMHDHFERWFGDAALAAAASEYKKLTAGKG